MGVSRTGACTVRAPRTLAAIAAASLILAGCASGASTGAAANSGADSGGGGGSGSDKLKIAMSISQTDTEFLGTLASYMDEQVTAAGWEMLPIVSAESNPDKQLNDIQNLLAQQPDILIVDATDSSAVVPGVEMANEKGVPVYAVDVPSAGGEVVATVRADNVQAGAIAAEIVLESVKKQACWASASCKVLEIQGRLASAAGADRSRGIEGVFAENPEVQLTSRPSDWDPQKALDETQSFVTANPDLAGIVLPAEWVIPGVVSILDSAGLTVKAGEPGHVGLAGVDGTPVGLDGIRKGTVTGASSQPAFDYVNAVIGIIQAVQFDGAKLKSGDAEFNGVSGTFVEIPSGLDFQVPAIAVTRENVDDDTLWGNNVK